LTRPIVAVACRHRAALSAVASIAVLGVLVVVLAGRWD
jgi:hypothetical protein